METAMASAEEEEDHGLITFLKEQQWKIDFRTEPARQYALKGSVQALGEVVPRLQSLAQVVSPVDGIVPAGQPSRY